MKSYKVVPSVANITVIDSTQAVAQRLETIINDFSSQGWSFESVEKFESTVNTPGWWGFGAKTRFFQVIVFSMED
jgi:hypothetical protein